MLLHLPRKRKTDWFHPRKAAGVEPDSVVPEFINNEIPVESCIFLSGKFEGLRVRIVDDGSCNPNMILPAIVKKLREELAQKLRPTDAVISNSRMGVEKKATEDLSGGRLIIKGSFTEYTSNSLWVRLAMTSSLACPGMFPAIPS